MPPARSIGRRDFLRWSGAFTAGVVAAACTRDPSVSAAASVSAAPPVAAGMGPDFSSGRPIEKMRTLRVYQWREYLADDVLRSFERRFDDVHVEVASFTQIDEAVAALADPAARYDVFFPTIDVLDGLIAAGLLRPLDHDLVPNVANLWGWFREGDGPFYDPGQRYTVPYTVYSSGIGWRDDLVAASDAPPARGDPIGLLWDEKYAGAVGVYDDYVEAMALAMQRAGVSDVRTPTDPQLAAAADSLSRAVARADLRFTMEGAWCGLPEGTFAAHQAWSGDVLTARRYALESGHVDGVDRLRYWSPSSGRVVGCDLMAVCERGRHPDLAHAFLDHLLDPRIGLRNFSWNGYQPPLDAVERSVFVDPSSAWHGIVPASLMDALLTPAEFGEGRMLVGFDPAERARWLTQWNRVAPAG